MVCPVPPLPAPEGRDFFTIRSSLFTEIRLAGIGSAPTPLRHGYAMPTPLKGRLGTVQNPRAPLEGKKQPKA